MLFFVSKHFEMRNFSALQYSEDMCRVVHFFHQITEQALLSMKNEAIEDAMVDESESNVISIDSDLNTL